MNDRRDDDATGGGALSPEEWVRLQFEALQEDVADEQRARGRRAAAAEPDAQPAAREPAESSEPADPAPLVTPPAPTTEPAEPAAPAWSEPVTPPPARRRAEPGSVEPAVDFGLPPTSLPPQSFSTPTPSTPASAVEPAPAEPQQVEPEPPATVPAEPAPAEPAAPEPADASARPSIDEHWGEPTQAMAAVPSAELDDDWGEPTQAMSLPRPEADDSWGEPTQAMPVPPTAVGPSTDSTSAEETGLDDLFGDNRFREVDDDVAGEAPPRAAERSREREAREPMPRNVKILAWVAGGLIAVLALLGLFWLGVQSPWSSAAPAPSPTATSETPTPTPEPTEEQPVVGPVAPGTYAWDELGGGECLEAFPNAWAEEYTVVDCAQPHAAQLVSLTELGQSTDPWPGLETLAGEANVRCAEAISLDAAGQYDDVVLEASYAATEEAWQDGDNAYSCFARRSGGEALEGSLQA